jgi:hypothetical protein
VHDSGSMQDAASGDCEIFNDYIYIGSNQFSIKKTRHKWTGKGMNVLF